jgi:hypothetical protein
MFLVTDIPTILASFERAFSQGGALGRVSLGCFFLKPSQAASKSVASINATEWGQADARSTNDTRSWSLIWRRPPTPRRDRNWWSMRTSGTRSRWDKRAKERQARCSPNNVNTWLREWAGVNTVNKWVRHSWAPPKYGRGPRAGRAFQCSLIKASGTNGSKRANNSAVPVIGNFDFITGELTLFKPVRLRKPDSNNFWKQQHIHKPLTLKLVTPSY